jgi:hypothetical protein
MQITRDTIVMAAPHQVSSQIDDEAALLNLKTGVYYGLDAMGAYIWQWLEEPISVRALQEKLLEDYDVDAATVEADLHEFLTEMLSAGLIELKPASSGAQS